MEQHSGVFHTSQIHYPGNSLVLPSAFVRSFPSFSLSLIWRIKENSGGSCCRSDCIPPRITRKNLPLPPSPPIVPSLSRGISTMLFLAADLERSGMPVVASSLLSADISGKFRSAFLPLHLTILSQVGSLSQYLYLTSSRNSLSMLNQPIHSFTIFTGILPIVCHVLISFSNGDMMKFLPPNLAMKKTAWPFFLLVQTKPIFVSAGRIQYPVIEGT